LRYKKQIFYPFSRTYYLTFVNADDEEFSIDPPNYMLLGFEGFEQPSTDIQMSKAPYQDGKTFIDDIFDERVVTLTFAVFADDQQELFDRRAIINQESIMVGFSGGFSFPFSFPVSFGQVGTQVTITNSGNVDTPVLIYFYGEVEEPVIENQTTDESITLTQTVDDGDILIINTAFGEKSVMLLSGGEYTNAFEYVDPDSDFWKLQPGDNTVRYTSSSEGENAECRLYYYNRYSGV